MVGSPGPSLKIAVFGTPDFAVPTLQRVAASQHAVVGVVTQPDRARGRGQRVTDVPAKRAAVELGIPVLQPERLKDPGFRDAFASLRADLAVVAAFGKILPEDLLASVPRGFINVHASLLPRYRGAAPIHRAILAGETETGVTIMRVVRELDAGPMLASRTYRIGPDATSDEVERGLAALGAALVVDVLDRIAAGTVTEVPQDHAQATYAARLTKDEGIIDWSRPAGAIHDQVRGLHPWPHAFTYLDGARLVVLRAAVGPPMSGATPGSIVVAHAEIFRVAAGDGRSVELRLVQPEGRRAMTAREFLAGHRLTSDARFQQPTRPEAETA